MLLGSVVMVKKPPSFPLTISYFARQAGEPCLSLSDTLSLATSTPTLFSGTVAWYCNGRDRLDCRATAQPLEHFAQPQNPTDF